MEKIQISNGNIYSIISGGISATDSNIVVSITANETVEELEKFFSDNEKLSLISSDGEVIRVFNGFSRLVSIAKNKDVAIETTVENNEESTKTADVIVITLEKVSDMEKRLTQIEQALLEIPEMLMGLTANDNSLLNEEKNTEETEDYKDEKN